MRRVHRQAKTELDEIREEQRTLTEGLVELVMHIARASLDSTDDAQLGQNVRELFAEQGGSETVLRHCEVVVVYHGDNSLPLLWGHYARHRRAVFDLVDQLDLVATTQDRSLLGALSFLQQHRDQDYLPPDSSLSFASQRW